jgi:transposase
MEATGVYWKPVWNILEGRFELLLASARHVRNVPGRKSDVNDATWLADLQAHGLVRPSFVPPKEIRELRELTRTKRQLLRERARHSQRIQKVLEDANIKIASVITNILGMSGRTILDALVEGVQDPERLASIGHRLKSSRKQRAEALRGRVNDHHRFLIKLHLQQVDDLSKVLEQLELRIEEKLQPFRWAVDLLTEIPGVGPSMAQTIIAEIGVDMERFPSAGHLVSWAGLVPRQDESAGQRRSTRLRKGAPWLKPGMVQAAWGAIRKKDSYYRAQYYRLKARRGGKKAIVAVAASMLTAIYHILRTGVVYQDLGPDYFDRIDRQRAARRHIHRLESLGYRVTIST